MDRLTILEPCMEEKAGQRRATCPWNSFLQNRGSTCRLSSVVWWDAHVTSGRSREALSFKTRQLLVLHRVTESVMSLPKQTQAGEEMNGLKSNKYNTGEALTKKLCLSLDQIASLMSLSRFHTKGDESPCTQEGDGPTGWSWPHGGGSAAQAGRHWKHCSSNMNETLQVHHLASESERRCDS